jgi:hypothetical protein
VGGVRLGAGLRPSLRHARVGSRCSPPLRGRAFRCCLPTTCPGQLRAPTPAEKPSRRAISQRRVRSTSSHYRRLPRFREAAFGEGIRSMPDSAHASIALIATARGKPRL